MSPPSGRRTPFSQEGSARVQPATFNELNPPTPCASGALTSRLNITQVTEAAFRWNRQRNTSPECATTPTTTPGEGQMEEEEEAQSEKVESFGGSCQLASTLRWQAVRRWAFPRPGCRLQAVAAGRWGRCPGLLSDCKSLRGAMRPRHESCSSTLLSFIFLPCCCLVVLDAVSFFYSDCSLVNQPVPFHGATR